MHIEVCIDNLESLLLAIEGGATRIELCSSLALGGLTPSYGMIKQAIAISSIPIFVMIRPRQGDFIYNNADVASMLDDIQMAKELGADGVVFGAITPQGCVDKKITHQLVQAANGLGTTFHRAFDHCQDPIESMQTIIDLGCDRILTSGLASTAFEGMETISNMVKQAQGNIEIMAGAGVNANNVAEIIEKTNVTAVHLSAKGIRKSEMEFIPQSIKMGAGSLDDFIVPLTQKELLEELVAVVGKF